MVRPAAYWRTLNAARCGCAVVLLLTVIQIQGPASSQSTSSVASSQSTTTASRRLHQATVKRSKAAAGTSIPTNSSSSKQLCQWDSADAVCTPTHEAWLSAGPGTPSSSYRRAVLMASARDGHCSQHTTAAACSQDGQMRCFWQGSLNATNGRCGSSDMEEMLIWSAKGFMTNVSLIPHAMTCPGTQAHSFFECYAFAGRIEACNSIPNCMLLETLGSIKNVCVPRAMQQQKLGGLRKLFSNLESLNPAAYGSCGGACWLRQAKECANVTSKEACTALSYCTYDKAAVKKAARSKLISMWDEDGDGELDGDASNVGHRVISAKAVRPRACRHKSQEFSNNNALDQAAQSIYKQCKAAATAAACEASNRSTPPVAAGAASRAAAVDWKSYKPSNTTVRCALPAMKSSMG